MSATNGSLLMTTSQQVKKGSYIKIEHASNAYLVQKKRSTRRLQLLIIAVFSNCFSNLKFESSPNWQGSLSGLDSVTFWDSSLNANSHANGEAIAKLPF